MSRDTKNHSHVVKQVKFLLIPNKREQQVVLYGNKLHQIQFFAGGRLIIKSQALTHLSSFQKEFLLAAMERLQWTQATKDTEELITDANQILLKRLY